MTSSALTFEAPERHATAAWRAHVVEFLVVGGGTLLLFPLAWIARAALGLDTAELAIGFLTFHAAFLINDPHFAVTYLLFYENARERAFGAQQARAQRARYLFAGFVVPVVLVGWALGSIAAGSAHALGLLIQLMFFLVRWHYVKQGFGVLAVLSARRGVRYTAFERGVVLAHCFAAWAYAWARPIVPTSEIEEKGVVYTALAHPSWLSPATRAVFAASAILLVWTLARKVRREGKLPPLVPLTGFLITVWLWTVYSNIDPLMIYVIPALHSIQYLFFVWLLKRNEAREAALPPRFGPSPRTRLALLGLSAVALGWVLLRGAPAFLDGARGLRTARALPDLGLTPYFAAFYAVVNLHHYFMDYVIWRRENRSTRYLQV